MWTDTRSGSMSMSWWCRVVQAPGRVPCSTGDFAFTSSSFICGMQPEHPFAGYSDRVSKQVGDEEECLHFSAGILGLWWLAGILQGPQNFSRCLEFFARCSLHCHVTWHVPRPPLPWAWSRISTVSWTKLPSSTTASPLPMSISCTTRLVPWTLIGHTLRQSSLGRNQEIPGFWRISFVPAKFIVKIAIFAAQPQNSEVSMPTFLIYTVYYTVYIYTLYIYI